MKIRGQKVYPLKERLRRLSRRVSGGCVEWQSTLRNGYGRLMVGSRSDNTRRSVSAHRLAYELYVGPVAPELKVCHKCDNPKCINPRHLFIGTQQDNVDDREKKGRNKTMKGAMNGQTIISAADVRRILRLKRSGVPRRKIVASTGVSVHIVKDVLVGRTWRHIKLPAPPVIDAITAEKEKS